VTGNKVSALKTTVQPRPNCALSHGNFASPKKPEQEKAKKRN